MREGDAGLWICFLSTRERERERDVVTTFDTMLLYTSKIHCYV